MDISNCLTMAGLRFVRGYDNDGLEKYILGMITIHELGIPFLTSSTKGRCCGV